MNLLIRAFKKRIYLLCIALAYMPFLSFGQGSTNQGFSPQTVNRLNQLLDSFQTNPANPYVGGISAYINVDGLANWEGASGHAARNVDAQNNLLPGGSPFTSATLSRMYSVTKTFTAALVLELAREGVFHLDDAVNQYIPFLAAINSGLSGAVTLRQLLVHESGYSDYANEMMLQIAVAFQPTHNWTVFEMLSFVHQLSTPGTIRRYSSTNYLVLGAIIEIATGQPLQQHFRNRFLTPLNLSSIYLDAREPQWPGSLLAAPHDNISPFNPIFTLTGQPTFPDAITNISAFPFTAIGTLEFSSGGLIGNAADMAEWGNALFGGRATHSSTLDAMLQSISSVPDQDGDYLGYGIFRTTRISATETFIGHDGNAPGYRSVMFYQPERKMTIALLTNYRGARLYDLAKALFEALPPFLCGNENKKEAKIIACYNGNTLCVDRKAAAEHIHRGAWLGACEEAYPEQVTTSRVADENAKKFFNEFSISPNPAPGQTHIFFTPQQRGQVSLQLLDMKGNLVKTIYQGFAEKGITRKVELNTSGLPAGLYIARLVGAAGIMQRKLVIAR